jgi:hypothetical protein
MPAIRDIVYVLIREYVVRWGPYSVAKQLKYNFVLHVSIQDVFLWLIWSPQHNFLKNIMILSIVNISLSWVFFNSFLFSFCILFISWHVFYILTIVHYVMFLRMWKIMQIVKVLCTFGFIDSESHTFELKWVRKYTFER